MTRRRYVMIEGELVEVTADYYNGRNSVPVIGDRHYDGLQTTDGVNISTRAKHREYMRRHGLATIDDFTGDFRRAEELRHRVVTEGYDPTRRRDIERAVHQVLDKGGKR